MVLGRAASTVVAEHNSGIYRGVIIGHTRDYIIQQIGRQAAAVIHSKELFNASEQEFPWPESRQRGFYSLFAVERRRTGDSRETA